MSAELAQYQVDYYRPNPHKHTTPCRRCQRRLESLLALYGIEKS